MVPSWIEIIDSDWKWYEITHNTGKRCGLRLRTHHYDDVIMTMLASQITSLTVVYSIVYSDVNQRKHQSSASLAFVREIHRGPVNFPHKWPVTRKMFPFDDVIMTKGTFFKQILMIMERHTTHTLDSGPKQWMIHISVLMHENKTKCITMTS